MFYSHEVLTSRKYGVATVWLVATLGQTSTLKKINRKQIQEVDVSKACETIVDPVAPMALRLQGNLLYGVSRVYLQQCGYVLSDAQNARNSMLVLLRNVKNLGLDLDAVKARPEQLILQDDPSFLPEHALALPPDLLDIEFGLPATTVRSGDSQSLTPDGTRGLQSSSHAGDLDGFILPSSSPGPAGSFKVAGADEDVGLSGLLSDHAGFQFEDPGFSFNEDGALVEDPPISRVTSTPVRPTGMAMQSYAGPSAKVREDITTGHGTVEQIPDDPMDINLPVFEDDLPHGASAVVQQPTSEDAEVIQSTSTASAPLRQKQRAARVLPVDSKIEIRNADLLAWNHNYLQNMDNALVEKNKSRAGHKAKKAAEQFVWGNGIGDISHQFHGIAVPGPFNMFMGDKLFENVTGTVRRKAGRPKRDRDSGIDEATQEESQKKRQKTVELEQEFGRGLEDEGFFNAGDDEVELPREAVSALDDEQIFSAMPWNISASIRGSSAVPRSGLNLTDQGRPGSRMVSASPLHGRGQPLSAEALKNLESDGDFDFGDDDFGAPMVSSSVNFGAAAPDVVSLKQKTRVTDALPAEGENFILFVAEAIADKRVRMQADDEDADKITLEELLPPAENSKLIASQGLMMVLALGTKGMLDVQQEQYWGDINLKLTREAKASNVVIISDGEDSESDATLAQAEVVDENMEDVEEGMFEEQFTAGHGGQQDDD